MVKRLNILSYLNGRRWKRNRINKGLMPLKMVLRSVTVTGIHQDEGIEDFYENILTKLNLLP